MSIKKFVVEHCPESILPLIRMPYRAVTWPVRKIKTHMICRKALKYLPYYQDELSREILYDRIRFLKGDIEAFISRAEKEGWTFLGLYRVDGSLDYAYGADSRGEYSDVVVLYDKEGRALDYTKRLMAIMYGADSFRCVKMDDFFSFSRIVKSLLIVPVIEDKYVPFSVREDVQYFDVFSPIDDEIIVDAGAYDGGTAIQFLEWGQGKVRHIYSFEFDPENAERCEEKLRAYTDKVTLIKKGTWDRDETMHVDTIGTAGSTVRNAGSTEVHLTSIDSVVKDEPVTFIKMDVEGAELKSLMGARETIIKNRPRLAICVYHKPEDLYEIPGYILSLVPEYKFLLRHYSSSNAETILYAYC
ncbi:MAG: FkbM family methyltransferase [Synergistaceae bacterium]|nr:FkbM family methyltransferase [Synergistaceae bacterium]